MWLEQQLVPRAAAEAAPRRRTCRQKIGPGEGQLNLVAWEGYTQPQWVKPFEKATGCKVHAKYARLVERDGHPDARGRRQPVRHGLGLGRRVAAPDQGRRRSAGQRQPDPKLEGLRAAAQVATAQHGRRQALRRVAPVGPEHAALEHQGHHDPADELELALRPGVQGQGHGSGQPDPDRRRGALPVEEGARASASRTRTS